MVSRISGHVIGQLGKWIPVGSAVTVPFEIGDATTYAPVSLTFGTVTSSAQLVASTTPGEHPSIGTSTIDPAQDVNRWWALTDGGVGFDVLEATFTFTASDVDPGAVPSAFVVGKWDGAWSLPSVGAGTATTITATAMTNLSEFAVGEPAADLAITNVAPPSVIAGAQLAYTITVTNLGPSDALDVTVTDLLSPLLVGATYCVDTGAGCGGSAPWTGSAAIGTLASGASVTLVISATVFAGTADGTVISNSATVAATTSDPDAGNDVASATTSVTVPVATSTPTPSPTPSATPRTPSPSPGSRLSNTNAGSGRGGTPGWLLAAAAAWLLLLAGLALGGAGRRAAGAGRVRR
jgi:uncharacterized repeat protein (TIGR01451 family)